MNKIISYLIIAIIFFLIGGGLGYLFFNKNCPAADNDNYVAGWQAAKDRLEKLGVIRPLDKNSETKRLSGMIKKIEDKKITLGITPMEPLADPELDNRLAVIGAETEIFQIKFKDQEQYEAELAQYKADNPDYKDLADTDDFPMPPDRIIKQPVLFSELSAGMRIIVDTDENIISTKEFTAKEITIQP